MTYDEILTYFQVDRRYQDKAQCRCPAHDDRHASLTVTRRNGSVLVHCHAGCSIDNVLSAAGLKKSDLFYQKMQPGSAWKNYVESRSKGRIEAVYNYVSLNGNYAFTKLRLQGKKILYGALVNDRFTYGLNGRSRKELCAIYVPGGIQAVKKAIAEGRPVFIPEGEKDVDTLTKQGCIAWTYGGVSDWQSDFAALVKGATVYVLADNDEPGRRVANIIQNDLQGIAKYVKMVVPMPDVPKADISDFFAAGHNREEFEQMLQREQSTVKEAVNRVECGKQSLVDQLRVLDVFKRFARNDKGLAELFSTVFKNVSRYNPTLRDWMYYDGIKWIADIEGMKAKRNAKKLADALLSYAVSSSGLEDERQRESCIKYASRLMNYRDRNIMINDAKDLNYFENEDLDREDFLLNCQNCVLDLSGDKPTQLKHDANLLLSKACNVDYVPDAKCELWEKTVSEIMEGDAKKIEYIQKVFGLCLTGCTAEEELYFFYGCSTRNGKSTICETILTLLADYGNTISPETLAIKQNKDSRTASPDIAKLAGSRLVIASEPPKRMIFDTSLVKTLTGRDRITARFLHQNEFTFTPKFKLILNTNYLPTITDSTIFKSGRVRIVTFNRHFSEQEQNKHLKDALKDELPGVLNWMIEGLYLYRKNGIEPPSSIQLSTKEYENDSDKIGRFISECLVKSDKNISAKSVYESYAKWCSDSGLGVDGRNNFYIELKTRNLFSASATVNGKTVKNVVRGYDFADEGFIELNDNIRLPFD